MNINVDVDSSPDKISIKTESDRKFVGNVMCLTVIPASAVGSRPSAQLTEKPLWSKD